MSYSGYFGAITLKSGNNLSDVVDISAARTNLNVFSKEEVAGIDEFEFSGGVIRPKSTYSGVNMEIGTPAVETTSTGNAAGVGGIQATAGSTNVTYSSGYWSNGFIVSATSITEAHPATQHDMSPYYVVSATKEENISGVRYAWYAFNNNTATSDFRAAGPTDSLKIALPVAKIVTK